MTYFSKKKKYIYIYIYDMREREREGTSSPRESTTTEAIRHYIKV